MAHSSEPKLGFLDLQGPPMDFYSIEGVSGEAAFGLRFLILLSVVHWVKNGQGRDGVSENGHFSSKIRSAIWDDVSLNGPLLFQDCQMDELVMAAVNYGAKTGDYSNEVELARIVFSNTPNQKIH